TGEYRLSHRVSPKGYYKGQQVMNKAANSNASNN
ncbi:MAG: 50S ribosomal protein L32, partial [Lactobacillus sp.]|nr:50S ribosomal protein L32 [Lactobacillus sp.]